MNRVGALLLWIGFCLGWGEATPTIRIEAPVLRHYSAPEALQLEYALRYHLIQNRQFQVPTPEQFTLDSLDPRQIWLLSWTVTRQDSMVSLAIQLQAPPWAQAHPFSHQIEAPYHTPHFILAQQAIHGLLHPDSLPPTETREKPLPRPWVAAAFWAGFTGLSLWQQKTVPSASQSLSSSFAAGSSNIPAFFSGNAPFPTLRRVAGAGSARSGQGSFQSLNPAGIAQSPFQIEGAGGRLPGGVTEWSAVGVLPCGNGLWQGHSIRYEGDSLAQSWLFTSTLAADLGYWFSGLQGIHMGGSLKGSSLALGSPHSPSSIAGSAMGWGLDWGLQWGMGHSFRLATALLDAIAMDRYHNRTTHKRYWEKRPLQWVSGLSWNTAYATTLLLDWHQGIGQENQEQLAFAFEKESWGAVRWAAGYRYGFHNQPSSWHAGLGAQMEVAPYTLQIDYALEAGASPGHWSALRQTIGTRLQF